MTTRPDKVLRVHFTGEVGIDSGAMAKEILARPTADVGNIMFPSGSPVDSTYNVQKGYFQSCGEIAAVSLAHGGTSPYVLQGCVYESIVNPETDFKSLNVEHTTAEEKTMLENIQHDSDNHRDTIVDHGYTGVRNRSFFTRWGGADEIGGAVTQKKGLKGGPSQKKTEGRGSHAKYFSSCRVDMMFYY